MRKSLSLLTLISVFFVCENVKASNYYTGKPGYYKGHAKVSTGVLLGGAVLAGGIYAAAKVEDKKNKENEANPNAKESHLFGKIESFMSSGSPRNGYYGNGYYNGGYYSNGYYK